MDLIFGLICWKYAFDEILIHTPKTGVVRVVIIEGRQCLGKCGFLAKIVLADQ